MDTVTISRDEYEMLLSAKENIEDVQAVADYVANPSPGIPAEYVSRIIAGESPLAVLREWKGFNQSSLSKASGVNRTQIADIESGRSVGSVATLRKLADTLELAIDDIV